ncbi:MAG: hypothetical protein R2716_11250 [Microthrixaceae bacterium]
MRLELDVAAGSGSARTGSVRTARGSFEVPLFMPVGTRGVHQGLGTHELAALSSSEAGWAPAG